MHGFGPTQRNGAMATEIRRKVTRALVDYWQILA
jgi:hypothetical protein